eukprot:6207849-Pleurochrysis_carterae.AAC.3
MGKNRAFSFLSIAVLVGQDCPNLNFGECLAHIPVCSRRPVSFPPRTLNTPLCLLSTSTQWLGEAHSSHPLRRHRRASQRWISQRARPPDACEEHGTGVKNTARETMGTAQIADGISWFCAETTGV